ncbi:MAG: tetratricopeptide repeat protein [Spirochaetes bacterium]|jgi:Tfp pilus assembly protein PilF|nr:tetratricopeptide repeat protein [Spirochaetota bacterium]
MKDMSINQQLNDILQNALNRISRRDYRNAEEILREGIVLDKHNPELLYNLAVVLLKQKKNTEAENNLITILSLPFSTVDILHVKIMLCYSYLNSGKYKQCGEHLISLIELAPNNVTALSLLGYYYEKIGKTEKAIKTYRTILTIDKQNLNAHNSFAYLSALAGQDLNRALTSARYCITKNPENPAYCDTAGYIYAKIGETGLSSKYLKKALSLMPGSEEIQAHLHELLKI